MPRWAALLGPALFAVALYLPSLGNPLVWDDELHVPLAREMTVGEAFGNAGGEYRRPLVLLSYLAQWKAGAGADAALHAVNVLLHSGNAMLLALLLLNMGLPTEVAACAALLFAAHPLQSGSVAYVSGRTDLLAAAFTMTALIVAQPAPSRTEPASTRVRSTSRSREMCVTLACAACVALAALSKEIGLVAGPLAALFVYYRIRRGRPASLLTAIAALMSCACCALWVLPPAALAANLPMSLRLRAAGTAAVTYAGLLVWPSGLHLDRLSPTRGDEALVIALALCALAAALSLRFARAPTLAGLGLLSVLALYLPGSGLIPVAPAIVERFVFTPEQFLYLPLAPLCALLAAALHRYSGNSALLVVTATLALASVPAVLARQREFAGAEQVYRATLAHSSSARACFNLGGLQLDDLRYAEAASSYERCVELSPHDGGARGQLAIAYQKLGRADQARANYRRAIELDDRSPLLWSNFATLDANEGRYGDAREKWQHALALDPSFPPALSALEKLERAMSR
ncbi:MAG: tetratricopeptide repeat protein [Deltaproteobacteria bacterium]|nr:tetratricopeptide repeat protein [Deltaproteobacteria bacterium]